jgi:hypothetical protein
MNTYPIWSESWNSVNANTMKNWSKECKGNDFDLNYISSYSLKNHIYIPLIWKFKDFISIERANLKLLLGAIHGVEWIEIKLQFQSTAY